MKSVIILVAAIGVAVFRPAKAQDIEYVSSTLQSGGILSITVSDGYAFCSIGHLLLTFSVSDPASPTLVNSSPTLGGDGALLRGNYIYFTRIYNVNPQVQLVDISDPLNPVEIIRFSGYSDDIYVDSSYIYITRSGPGLFIFDNSDPSNPVEISSINTPNLAHGLDVVGQYAYIADFDSGLTVIDVGDPYNPNIVGRYDGPFTGSHRLVDVSALGDYAYVADNASGLQVIDISSGFTPGTLHLVNTPAGYGLIGSIGQGCFLGDQSLFIKTDNVIVKSGHPERSARLHHLIEGLAL